MKRNCEVECCNIYKHIFLISNKDCSFLLLNMTEHIFSNLDLFKETCFLANFFLDLNHNITVLFNFFLSLPLSLISSQRRNKENTNNNVMAPHHAMCVLICITNLYSRLLNYRSDGKRRVKLLINL